MADASSSTASGPLALPGGESCPLKDSFLHLYEEEQKRNVRLVYDMADMVHKHDAEVQQLQRLRRFLEEKVERLEGQLEKAKNILHDA